MERDRKMRMGKNDLACLLMILAVTSAFASGIIGPIGFLIAFVLGITSIIIR